MAVEERVQIALDNWAPRFIANGIDVNVLQQLARTIQRWEDWSPTWSAVAVERARMGEEAEGHSNFVSAGEHYFAAAMLYHFGKFMVVRHPDQLRAGEVEAAGSVLDRHGILVETVGVLEGMQAE